MNKLVCVLVLWTSLCLAGDDNANGRRITWTPGSYEGSFYLSSVLLEANIDEITVQGIEKNDVIETADCTASVVRPRTGFGPLIDEKNHLVCDVMLSDGHGGVIYWDLSTTPIHRWGNQFFPKGFSIKGKLSASLYAAFEKVYKKVSDNPYLRFKDVHLPSATMVYDFTDYLIYKDPYVHPLNGPTGTPTINCTKEYYYYPGIPRPSHPDSERCDFVYQWRYLPGTE